MEVVCKCCLLVFVCNVSCTAYILPKTRPFFATYCDTFYCDFVLNTNN